MGQLAGTYDYTKDTNQFHHKEIFDYITYIIIQKVCLIIMFGILLESWRNIHAKSDQLSNFLSWGFIKIFS